MMRTLFSSFATCLVIGGCLVPLAGCADDEVTPTASETSSNAASGVDAVVAAHVKVIERRIAANNAQDWKTWESLHVASAVRTAPGLPGPVVGASEMRKRIEELHQAFPDYTLTLKEAFGQGDALVVRIHQSGTMKGPIELGGTVVPATGKQMSQEWVALVRFEGDKIARFDEFYDNYDLLLQLGLAGQ